jgi:hypothetical protein
VWFEVYSSFIFFSNIDKKKTAFLEISERSAAMKRAKKEAYFQVPWAL